MAERAAADKSGTAIKADGFRLKVPGFEPQEALARPPRSLLEAAQHRLGQSAPAHGRARVHAFDLGIVVEQRNAAARDGLTVKARKEDTHVRFKQLGYGQPVALVRLVGGIEHSVELADEVVYLGRGLAHALDGEIH